MHQPQQLWLQYIIDGTLKKMVIKKLRIVVLMNVNTFQLPLANLEESTSCKDMENISNTIIKAKHKENIMHETTKYVKKVHYANIINCKKIQLRLGKYIATNYSKSSINIAHFMIYRSIE